MTPIEVLTNLFESDASPELPADSKGLAKLVVEFLQASGFKIVADDEEGDR